MDMQARALRDDYRVPSYFPYDLLELVGDYRRPPYYWFLVGPRRSGTCIDVEPLTTSSWTTVISGRKRWVLFPPETPEDVSTSTDCFVNGVCTTSTTGKLTVPSYRQVAKGSYVYYEDEEDEPINYFVDILPRIKQKFKVVYDIIQDPGDTLFVPSKRRCCSTSITPVVGYVWP